MPEYMTINELKKTLHIGNDKAYKLCGTRGFPAFRIGEGQWLIDSKKLDKWVDDILNTPDKTFTMGMMISFNNDLFTSDQYTSDEKKQILELLTPDYD